MLVTLAIVSKLAVSSDLSTACPLYAVIRSDRVPSSYDIMRGSAFIFQAKFMKLEMPSFQEARILVVGDVMLDRYWHGSASRISPEARYPSSGLPIRKTAPEGLATLLSTSPL